MIYKVILSMYEFFLVWNIKEDILKNIGNQTVAGSH